MRRLTLLILMVTAINARAGCGATRYFEAKLYGCGVGPENNLRLLVGNRIVDMTYDPSRQLWTGNLESYDPPIDICKDGVVPVLENAVGYCRIGTAKTGPVAYYSFDCDKDQWKMVAESTPATKMYLMRGLPTTRQACYQTGWFDAPIREPITLGKREHIILNVYSGGIFIGTKQLSLDTFPTDPVDVKTRSAVKATFNARVLEDTKQNIAVDTSFRVVP